jgi:hypothetical protein
MISFGFVLATIVGSLGATLAAYLVLSRHEGNYLNVLLPSLVIGVPAYYLLPLLYVHLFGADASPYAYLYVYGTFAAENAAFVFAYVRTGDRKVRLPSTFGYGNFTGLAWIFIILAIAIYLPVLVQFREFLLDPREIYRQTRTGFGIQFYFSSVLAYLAIILILFSKRNWRTRGLIIALATAIVSLHGSKGQVIAVVFLLVLYFAYVAGFKAGFLRAVTFSVSVAVLAVALFSMTMALGDGPEEMLQTISEYSDYTRNAMLVIDSHLPLRYGRIAWEANTLILVPRALMPTKPKNFGPFYLAEEFFPAWFDSDTGAPAFGIGVQYADFGSLAILYLTLFALLKGWLARVFVNRLKVTKHPADFFMIAFLAEIPLFPVGAGWFFPEALIVAFALRSLSRWGSSSTFKELRVPTSSTLNRAIRNLRPLQRGV